MIKQLRGTDCIRFSYANITPQAFYQLFDALGWWWRCWGGVGRVGERAKFGERGGHTKNDKTDGGNVCIGFFLCKHYPLTVLSTFVCPPRSKNRPSTHPPHPAPPPPPPPQCIEKLIKRLGGSVCIGKNNTNTIPHPLYPLLCVRPAPKTWPAHPPAPTRPNTATTTPMHRKVDRTVGG